MDLTCCFTMQKTFLAEWNYRPSFASFLSPEVLNEFSHWNGNYNNFQQRKNTNYLILLIIYGNWHMCMCMIVQQLSLQEKFLYQLDCKWYIIILKVIDYKYLPTLSMSELLRYSNNHIFLSKLFPPNSSYWWTASIIDHLKYLALICQNTARVLT